MFTPPGQTWSSASPEERPGELSAPPLKLLLVFVVQWEFGEGRRVLNAARDGRIRHKVEQLDYTDYKPTQDIIIE